jgi:hypothetical protein
MTNVSIVIPEETGRDSSLHDTMCPVMTPWAHYSPGTLKDCQCVLIKLVRINSLTQALALVNDAVTHEMLCSCSSCASLRNAKISIFVALERITKWLS